MIHKGLISAILPVFILTLHASYDSSLDQEPQEAVIRDESNKDLVSVAAEADSSLDSGYQKEIDNPHYSSCAATCEKIWQKWPNVTNKELCQQECLIKVMDTELNQSLKEDKSPKEGKKKDKKEHKKKDD